MGREAVDLGRHHSFINRRNTYTNNKSKQTSTTPATFATTSNATNSTNHADEQSTKASCYAPSTKPQVEIREDTPVGLGAHEQKRFLVAKDRRCCPRPAIFWSEVNLSFRA
jgi:hypothetical protein